MCGIKVHRIQNKLLWAAYAGNRFAMKGRWRDEKTLPHINGGGSMLWHGTGRIDPWVIYAAEHGTPFSFHATIALLAPMTNQLRFTVTDENCLSVPVLMCT